MIARVEMTSQYHMYLKFSDKEIYNNAVTVPDPALGGLGIWFSLPKRVPRESFWSGKSSEGRSPAERFAIILEKGLREGTPVLFGKCRSAIEAIYVDGGIRLTKGVKSATAATMRRTLTALDELRLLKKI